MRVRSACVGEQGGVLLRQVGREKGRIRATSVRADFVRPGLPLGLRPVYTEHWCQEPASQGIA